ncbi:acyl-CoA synthetase [Falsibacillus pallidus]|uniref:acyl-CoA synthetase n=1 Tax=Falsibacillus pallidus TaxID=493781 RepID=UPI003D98B62E
MLSHLNWMESRARLTPDEIAIIDGETEKKTTYHELNERAGKWAAFLAGKGAAKGDRICLIEENDGVYFELMFACAKLGAIFVPLNWRLGNDELEQILEDCRPKVLLYGSTFSKIAAERSFWVETIRLESVDVHEEAEHFNHLPVREEDPWIMIYTGGTTGRPKGVVLTHQSVNWNALNTIISWNLTKDDTTLTYLPLFHTGGINALSMPILMMGGTVVIGKQFEPVTAIRQLIKYQCTIALFVPTMYHMMIHTEEFEKAEFKSMNVFLSGGAPCPLSIYDVFIRKGLPFKEGYGLTEAGPNNFYIDPKDAKKKKGSVGKEMMFNSIRILKEDGTEAGGGEVGELLISGKHVFAFYWNDPSSTSQSLKDDGWLYTGDLAKRDEEGYVYIVGRKKDMIITGGENVYPLEIEHWICEHNDINEAAVIGLTDEKWGERVAAFVSLKKGASLSEEELKYHCQLKFTNYKIPKEFHFIDSLPKTDVGKIDKKTLKLTYEK